MPSKRWSQPLAGVRQVFHDSHFTSRCHARSRQWWLILFSLGLWRSRSSLLLQRHSTLPHTHMGTDRSANTILTHAGSTERQAASKLMRLRIVWSFHSVASPLSPFADAGVDALFLAIARQISLALHTRASTRRFSSDLSHSIISSVFAPTQRPNKSLQSTALWRCAPMPILINISSIAAKPRSPSGG